MREHQSFPPNTNLLEIFRILFPMLCSIEVNAKGMACVAAALANGGINPLTEDEIFEPETVKNCLSLMGSCGMYDFSGEFSFKIGLPAKSGVSGVVILVIPNVMGISIWSPRLDKLGNSVREFSSVKNLSKNLTSTIMTLLSPKEFKRKTQERNDIMTMTATL